MTDIYILSSLNMIRLFVLNVNVFFMYLFIIGKRAYLIKFKIRYDQTEVNSKSMQLHLLSVHPWYHVLIV